MTHDTSDLAGVLADLRAEFPGWDIGVDADDPDGSLWYAGSAAPGRGCLTLESDSLAVLRELLDEADRIDSRHAIIALRDALRALRVSADVYGQSVTAATHGGGQRVVTARRGTYTWSSGVPLAPIGDPAGAAARMLPGLGLEAPLQGGKWCPLTCDKCSASCALLANHSSGHRCRKHFV